MSVSGTENDSTPVSSIFELVADGNREALTEAIFKRMLGIERKRTERSREPFLLMLLGAGNHHASENSDKALDSMLPFLLSSVRETDVIGWYKDRITVGVIFTGLADNDKNSILSVILSRLSDTFRTFDHFNQINISFHFFPDDWDHYNPGCPSDPTFYPDPPIRKGGRQAMLRIKRGVDIVGSVLMLVLCLPLFMIIALAIIVSSRGPVLFRQQRVGQYGKTFTFLKFRSMYIGSDPGPHREYATKLIAGEEDCKRSIGKGDHIYKLTNDNRVTRVGKFLRKTSLDELPQLLNVLKGEMSLVGPRPAIPYEVAAYQLWHRRRVVEAKPGLTGLWQVSGRCRIKFDEMVRLDLRYAASWSPWLDLKILLRTPLAMIKGTGAY